MNYVTNQFNSIMTVYFYGVGETRGGGKVLWRLNMRRKMANARDCQVSVPGTSTQSVPGSSTQLVPRSSSTLQASQVLAP